MLKSGFCVHRTWVQCIVPSNPLGYLPRELPFRSFTVCIRPGVERTASCHAARIFLAFINLMNQIHEPNPSIVRCCCQDVIGSTVPHKQLTQYTALFLAGIKWKKRKTTISSHLGGTNSLSTASSVGSEPNPTVLSMEEAPHAEFRCS